MVAKKKTQTTSQANVKASLGRKYFDVLDTYTNKILSNLVEQSVDLGIDKENLKKISLMLEAEKVKAKNWGFDQISSTISS